MGGRLAAFDNASQGYLYWGAIFPVTVLVALVADGTANINQ